MARFFFYFILILGFFQYPVFSEACENIVDSNYRIRDFFIKDFSRNLFLLQIEADSPELLTEKFAVSPEDELEIKNSKFQLYVGKIKATNMKGSYTPFFKGKSRKMEWEVIPEKTIEAGTHCVTLRDQEEKVLDQFSYTIKETRKEPGQQPLILQFQPRGGPIGDTITVKAQNLGKDISQIYFYVLKPLDKQGSYAFKDKEACVLFPYYLSHEITEAKLTYQEVKFTLANYLMKDCALDEDFTFYERIFGKELKIKLYVNARPSTVESTMVLYENWRRYAITMGLLITFLFLGILTVISQKINFFPDIFIDPDTNSYSLANLQAFCWTVVLMGSYFYIAICQGMILHNMELPDFNFSLIALLGVSYGGMITHNYIDKRKKDLIFKKNKPEIRDFIFDPKGGIDMARMQLFGFNMICLILYVYYLIKSNPLYGLPTIPETLHTLLGTSQAGYIGSQAVTQIVAHNVDFPKGDSSTEKESQQDPESEKEVEKQPVKKKK